MLNFTFNVKVDRRKEWQQIFDESYRVMKYRYYDPKMHGKDWTAIKAKYQPLLKYAGTNEDVYDIANAAIGIVANAAVVRLIGVDLNGGAIGNSDIAQPTAVAAKRRCTGGIIVDDECHAVGGLVGGAAEGVGEARIEGRDVLDGIEEGRSDLAVDGVCPLQLAADEADGVAVELPAAAVEVTGGGHAAFVTAGVSSESVSPSRERLQVGSRFGE